MLQWILFLTVALISVKSEDNFLTQDFILWETLIAEITSLNQWDQRKQTHKTVYNKEFYEDIETSLIEILLKFLRVNSLLKHMLEEITAYETHSELLNSHSLWLWRKKILYFNQMLYISYTETLQIKIILKYYNNSLAEHLITEKIFTLIELNTIDQTCKSKYRNTVIFILSVKEFESFIKSNLNFYNQFWYWMNSEKYSS